MQMNIVYSLNDKYAAGAACSIRSLCCNTLCTDDLEIYILCSGLSDENSEKFSRLAEECSVKIYIKTIQPESYVNGKCLYAVDYLTREMYFRLFIADILPDKDKALYIDCDTIINGDIREVYDIDISGHILGAVCDLPNVPRTEELKKLGLNKETYFNSGVMLMNLKMFRKEEVLKRSLSFLEKNRKLICPDQDVLNIICGGKVRYLDDRWNFQWGHYIDNFLFLTEEDANRYKKAMNRFLLLHFTSPRKPWNSFVCPELGAYFWKYALDTPFKDELSISIIENGSVAYLDNEINDITDKRFLNGEVGFKYILKFLRSWMLHKIKK